MKSGIILFFILCIIFYIVIGLVKNKEILKNLIISCGICITEFLCCAVILFFIDRYKLSFNIILCLIFNIFMAIAFLTKKKLNFEGIYFDIKKDLILIFLIIIICFTTSQKSEIINTVSDAGAFFEKSVNLANENTKNKETIEEYGEISDLVDESLYNLQNDQPAYYTELSDDNKLEYSYRGINTWTVLISLFYRIFGFTASTQILSVLFVLAFCFLFYGIENISKKKFAKYLSFPFFGFSPLLIYLSKTPVAEITFLFLVSFFVMLVSSKERKLRLLSILPLCTLPFIHGTLLIYMPIVYLAIMLMSYYYKKKDYLIINISLLIAVFISVCYLLITSKTYFNIQVMSIFKQFKLTSELGLILIIAVGIIMLIGVNIILYKISMNNKKCWILSLIKILDNKLIIISQIIVLICAIFTIYHGYLLGFTNKLTWGAFSWGYRSDYADQGIISLQYLNIVSIMMALSYIGLPYIFYKLFSKKVNWTPSRKILLLIFLYSLCYFTINKIDTPAHYNIARYLAFCLLPMGVLLISVLVENKKTFIVLSFIAFLTALPFNLVNISAKEEEGNYEVLNDVLENIDGNSTVFVNESDEYLQYIKWYLLDYIRDINRCNIYSIDVMEDVIKATPNGEKYIISESSIDKPGYYPVFVKQYKQEFIDLSWGGTQSNEGSILYPTEKTDREVKIYIYKKMDNIDIENYLRTNDFVNIPLDSLLENGQKKHDKLITDGKNEVNFKTDEYDLEKGTYNLRIQLELLESNSTGNIGFVEVKKKSGSGYYNRQKISSDSLNGNMIEVNLSFSDIKQMNNIIFNIKINKGYKINIQSIDYKMTSFSYNIGQNDVKDTSRIIRTINDLAQNKDNSGNIFFAGIERESREREIKLDYMQSLLPNFKITDIFDYNNKPYDYIIAFRDDLSWSNFLQDYTIVDKSKQFILLISNSSKFYSDNMYIYSHGELLSPQYFSKRLDKNISKEETISLPEGEYNIIFEIIYPDDVEENEIYLQLYNGISKLEKIELSNISKVSDNTYHTSVNLNLRYEYDKFNFKIYADKDMKIDCYIAGIQIISTKYNVGKEEETSIKKLADIINKIKDDSNINYVSKMTSKDNLDKEEDETVSFAFLESLLPQSKFKEVCYENIKEDNSFILLRNDSSEIYKFLNKYVILGREGSFLLLAPQGSSLVKEAKRQGIEILSEGFKVSMKALKKNDNEFVTINDNINYLLPGEYKVKVKFKLESCNDDEVGVFKINDNKHSNITTLKINKDDFNKNNTFETEISFLSDDSMDNVEFKLYQNEGCKIESDIVYVEKICAYNVISLKDAGLVNAEYLEDDNKIIINSKDIAKIYFSLYSIDDGNYGMEVKGSLIEGDGSIIGQIIDLNSSEVLSENTSDDWDENTSNSFSLNVDNKVAAMVEGAQGCIIIPKGMKIYISDIIFKQYCG